MEGNVGRACFDEVADDTVDRADHQVHVDGCRHAVLAQGGADHRADRQVGNVVVVHDIEMHDIGAGGENVVDFFAQASEIRGKDGRSNGKRLHGAPVGLKHGGAHCTSAGGPRALTSVNPDKSPAGRTMQGFKAWAFYTLEVLRQVGCAVFRYARAAIPGSTTGLPRRQSAGSRRRRWSG
ncbi:hypothetical protein D3C80_1140650 [compost metagenome]